LADAVALQPPEKRFEYEFVSAPGVEDRLNIEPAAQIQIYRIVQEALSNICRHASASHVVLTVAVDVDRNLTVDLEDDGVGFDPRASVVIGRGLSNIRSRASLIDARVSWSRSGKGGTIFSLRRSNT
jgi:signal transduction histidine kinase